MRPGLFARLDDRLNPIVVKELRQAVHSRLVVSVLMFFLIVQLAVVAIYLLSAGSGGRLEAADFEGGREVFPILQGVLLGTCMLFLPGYTGGRLGAERSEANVDLLFITTLRPRSIIAGKSLAALVLAVLVFSTCAPFMVFTYLLRGIDAPSIFLVLGIDFLAVVLAVQVAIFLAVIPGTRVGKGLFGGVGFVLLFYLFMGLMASTVEFIRFGFGPLFDLGEFFAAVVVLVVAVVSAGALFYSWSVALISPPSANRALPVRLMNLAVWVVTGAACYAWARSVGHARPVAVWLGAMTSLAGLGLVIAINERDHWGPRVARTIPRRIWLRPPAFLLYSGAAGGLAFALVLFGLTALAVKLWEGAFPHALYVEGLDIVLGMVGILYLYAYAYALTAVLVRWLLAGRIRPEHTWGVMLFLLAVGTAVPSLTGLLARGQNWDYNRDFVWLLGNPFAAAADVGGAARGNSHAGAFWTFAGTWAGVVTLLNLPWLAAQAARFRPYLSAAVDVAALAPPPAPERNDREEAPAAPAPEPSSPP